jgi:hypothetical protein
MQIHDITKRKKVNEGLLDGVKATIQTAKTGAQGGKGVMGAVKALGSNQAYAAAQSDVYSQQIDKLAPAVSDKLVQTAIEQARRAPATKSVFDQVVSGVDQVIKTKSDNITQNTPDTNPQSKITPPAGRAIKVAIPGKDGVDSVYYKDEKNVWYNELGQIVPPESTRNLENATDSGGTQVSANEVPGATARRDAYNKKQRDLKMQNKRKVTREQLGNIGRVNPDRVLITQDELANIVDQTISANQTYSSGWEKGKQDPQFKTLLTKQLTQAYTNIKDPAKFKEALSQYVTTAMASAITHMNSGGGYRSSPSTASNATGEEAQKFDTITDQLGLSQYQLKNLGAQIGAKNQTVNTTNNPMLNKLLQSLGVRLS